MYEQKPTPWSVIKPTDQSVVGSDHLSDESTPADVVLQVGAHLQLEPGPAAAESICAELQEKILSLLTICLETFWTFLSYLIITDLLELLV